MLCKPTGSSHEPPRRHFLQTPPDRIKTLRSQGQVNRGCVMRALGCPGKCNSHRAKLKQHDKILITPSLSPMQLVWA